MQAREKIVELQKMMRTQGLDAWLVPSADPHQSEYPANRWKTRAWLSGFTGSAGTLVVTQEKAGLWVDPRYHIRAEQELQGSGIQPFKTGLPEVPSYAEWLARELKPGAVIGFDGNVFPVTEMKKLCQAFADIKIAFSYQRDLVDQLWQDRPGIPENPVWLYRDEFAGETRTSKLQRIREKLRQHGAQAQLISGLDDIAWTLNIRGSDVEYNPVAISYLIVTDQEARLFIHPNKVSPQVRECLENDGIALYGYDELLPHVRQFSREITVLIDPEKTSYNLEQALSKTCHVKEAVSAATTLKALKNPTETSGMRMTQLRDGVALARWLYWLGHFSWNSPQTEITLAEKLTAFRQLGEHYQGLSFGTICGYQVNSAVGHYSAQAEATPTIKPEGILLIDSGAQYLDGTTDITRTLALSAPTQEQKRAFSIVLKCHIRLARATFPKGTTGSQLDALAREYLWQQGWNCRHGIGHGVGHFLNVHEGQQRFSPENSVALEPGMLLSNEPGVYFEGKFGVRIENLLITVQKETTGFGEFLGFETVSLCPIDLDLVDVSMLDLDERNWLNEYHRRVCEAILPFLSKSEQVWLRRATHEI